MLLLLMSYKQKKANAQMTHAGSRRCELYALYTYLRRVCCVLCRRICTYIRNNNIIHTPHPPAAAAAAGKREKQTFCARNKIKDTHTKYTVQPVLSLTKQNSSNL